MTLLWIPRQRNNYHFNIGNSSYVCYRYLRICVEGDGYNIMVSLVTKTETSFEAPSKMFFLTSVRSTISKLNSDMHLLNCFQITVTWIIMYHCLYGRSIDIDNGPWTIQLQNSNFEPPIDKEEYFCKELLEVCTIKNCKHYIHHINTIPSQRLFTNTAAPSKDNLRIPIDNWQHHGMWHAKFIFCFLKTICFCNL